MADIPDKPEGEKDLATPPPAVDTPLNKQRSIFSGLSGIPKGKAALLLALIFIVVLGSVALLTSQALKRKAAPAHPPVAANSNAAMFGFDLQHTHFNSTEHILNTANVSHLVSYWTASTGSYIIASPTVANGIVYIGSYDQKLICIRCQDRKDFVGSQVRKVQLVLRRQSLLASFMSAPMTTSSTR